MRAHTRTNTDLKRFRTAKKLAKKESNELATQSLWFIRKVSRFTRI